MSSKKGRSLHNEAEIAREKSQNFLESLQKLDEAILVYEEDNDLRGLSEALQSRSSAFKHLYQKTNNTAFLIIAKHDSLSGVEIAESLSDRSSLTLAYRGLAKIYEALLDWKEAKRYFQMALDVFEKFPPMENNRPAVRNDMKAHLAHATFMSGEKENGLKIMDEAITGLAGDKTEEKYNIDVWLSGAYMRLATMLMDTDSSKAVKQLELAEKIISSNPDLKLRADQLKKLRDELKHTTTA